MSLKCILQGQNDKGLKLDNNILKQNDEDVTTQVKSALNAADATIVSGHIADTSIHVTANEKEKLAKAVTSSGLVYNSGLPAKPSAPIAANEEIPYSWDELNSIALSGKAADYVSVGAIKSVTLSEAVLGTTTHDVRIIGINQDNDQSITFQTKNCLANTTVFGSSAVWIDSTVRSLCQNYYNAFPGKAAIKTVSKGTCPSTDSSRNGTPTYNNETVFLLSEREFGLDSSSPLSTANSTTSRAECTNGKNFAYSYYTSNATRVMYLGNALDIYGYPYERSRNYKNSNSVCVVGSDGTAYSYSYDFGRGLAPAFVIGNGEISGSLVQDGIDVTDKVKNLMTTYTYGTEDLVAGTSLLKTGYLYLVYEE